MARRGKKGGWAVQLKRLKRELCASGTFNPDKVFPKEIPTVPKTDSPPSRTVSSGQPRENLAPRPRHQPKAKETFCPARIPTRPLRPSAPLRRPKLPKILEQKQVNGLVKIINKKMFTLKINK